MQRDSRIDRRQQQQQQQQCRFRFSMAKFRFWWRKDGGSAGNAAMIIANDPGGGGTFYYAVLAVNESGSYRATNALLLGDRIAPLTVDDFLDGRFVYNYAQRRPGEPMTANPSVRTSLWIRFDRASGVISGGS